MMLADKPVWAELPVLPANELVPLVQRLEATGVEGVWAPQIFGAPFTTLAAAAAVTVKEIQRIINTGSSPLVALV